MTDIERTRLQLELAKLKEQQWPPKMQYDTW